MKHLAYIILALAAVTLSAASCSRSRTLTLVSYNVGAFHKYTGDSSPMVAAMMRELDPDFIALNELDSCCRRTGSVYQLKAFAAELGKGWDYSFAKAIDYGGGSYGIGVAVSPGHKVIGTHRLPLGLYDGSEERALCVVETEDCVFASTHLDHRGDTVRVCQARDISAWMKEHYAESSKPVILAGDFNETRDGSAIAEFRKDWDIVSPDSFTYSSTDPHACIDNIMVLKNGIRVNVLDAGVATDFKNGSAEEASDHLPVFVRVEFR